MLNLALKAGDSHMHLTGPAGSDVDATVRGSLLQPQNFPSSYTRPGCHRPAASLQTFPPRLSFGLVHLSFECHRVPDSGSTNVARVSEGSTVRTGFQKVCNGVPVPLLWAFGASYEHIFTGTASCGRCLGPTLQASDSPTGVLHSVNQRD